MYQYDAKLFSILKWRVRPRAEWSQFKHQARREDWNLREHWQVLTIPLSMCGIRSLISKSSGKSSFILAMFRMIELSAGSIIVDDIDISTLPRNLVRSSFVAVPQEPFLFDGSIRLNVDPTRSKSDEAIREVLQMVQLGDVVNDRGSLDKSIDEVQLSHGQKQLLCLARALLRPGKIVLLDEATSRYVCSTLPSVK
jgi:ABC-type transport system involved in cytochrome bd biosynthesis fused ATPase/permease subunit